LPKRFGPRAGVLVAPPAHFVFVIAFSNHTRIIRLFPQSVNGNSRIYFENLPDARSAEQLQSEAKGIAGARRPDSAAARRESCGVQSQCLGLGTGPVCPELADGPGPRRRARRVLRGVSGAAVRRRSA